MSLTAQGPGWWMASDGKFYPPEQMPTAQRPAEPPKKKFYKRVWFWLLIAVVVLFGGCSALLAGGSAVVDHAAHIQHTVVYSVTGTGQASNVTYSTVQEGSGQNGEAQVTDVSLPWTKTIKASGLITLFDVSATVGQDGGTVTCTITEDGKQLASNTASGAFASADCTTGGK